MNNTIKNDINIPENDFLNEDYEVAIIILLIIILSLYVIILLIGICTIFMNSIKNVFSYIKYCSKNKFDYIRNYLKNTNNSTVELNNVYINPVYNAFEIINIKSIPDNIHITNCSICLEKINNNNISYINCNHTFHSTCINKWIETNQKNGLEINCPNCRELINKIYIS